MALFGEEFIRLLLAHVVLDRLSTGCIALARAHDVNGADGADDYVMAQAAVVPHYDMGFVAPVPAGFDDDILVTPAFSGLCSYDPVNPVYQTVDAGASSSAPALTGAAMAHRLTVCPPARRTARLRVPESMSSEDWTLTRAIRADLGCRLDVDVYADALDGAVDVFDPVAFDAVFSSMVVQSRPVPCSGLVDLHRLCQFADDRICVDRVDMRRGRVPHWFGPIRDIEGLDCDPTVRAEHAGRIASDGLTHVSPVDAVADGLIPVEPGFEADAARSMSPDAHMVPCPAGRFASCLLAWHTRLAGSPGSPGFPGFPRRAVGGVVHHGMCPGCAH